MEEINQRPGNSHAGNRLLGHETQASTLRLFEHGDEAEKGICRRQDWSVSEQKWSHRCEKGRYSCAHSSPELGVELKAPGIGHSSSAIWFLSGKLCYPIFFLLIPIKMIPCYCHQLLPELEWWSPAMIPKALSCRMLVLWITLLWALEVKHK